MSRMPSAATDAIAVRLDRRAIARRVPHAGAMCLLDGVLAWNAQSIDCIAALDPSRLATHPLARDGRLPASAAIEYAAQAMAVHGSLLADPALAADADGRAASDRGPAAGRPSGRLAAVRGVELPRRWIPPAAALLIHGERFAGDAQQVIYDFEVRAQALAQTPAEVPAATDDGRPATAPLVARGRAVVILTAANGAAEPQNGAPAPAGR